jgi:hypothetical protein
LDRGVEADPMGAGVARLFDDGSKLCAETGEIGPFTYN